MSHHPIALELGKVDSHHSRGDRLATEIGDQSVVVHGTLGRAALGVILDHQLYVHGGGRMIWRRHAEDRSLIRVISRLPTKGEPPSLTPRGYGDTPEYKICRHSVSFP